MVYLFYKYLHSSAELGPRVIIGVNASMTQRQKYDAWRGVENFFKITRCRVTQPQTPHPHSITTISPAPLPTHRPSTPIPNPPTHTPTHYTPPSNPNTHPHPPHTYLPPLTVRWGRGGGGCEVDRQKEGRGLAARRGGSRVCVRILVETSI